MELNSRARTANTMRSLVWGFLNKILAILLPFASRTAIIKFLGIEYAGLGSLFTSILSVLSLAELGIGSALVFSMYRPVAEGNIQRINAYLNFYKKCYRIIGLVVLSLGLLIFPFLPFLVSGDVPPSINLYVLFSIYLLNSVASYFLFAYKSSILSATQRNDIKSNISSIVLISMEFTQLVLLIAFKNYYFYVACLPVFTLMQNAIIALVVKKMYPYISAKGDLQRSDIVPIKEKVFGLLFQKIGSIVLSSVDTIVISAFLGLKVLGIYNNYYYIITALFGFFTIIQSSLIPSVGNSLITSSKEKNYKDFRVFHFLYIWCSIFCSACLLCLYQPFMEIWVGSENMLEMSVVFFLPVYFFMYKLNDVCYIYREAAGLWKEWKYVNLIAAIINLIINLALVRFIGLYGIVLSTILCLVFIYTPFFTFPVFSKFFGEERLFYKYLRDCLVYLVVGFIVCLVSFFLCSFMQEAGFVGLMVKFLIVFASSNILLLFFALSNKNGRSAISFALNVFRRKRT